MNKHLKALCILAISGMAFWNCDDSVASTQDNNQQGEIPAVVTDPTVDPSEDPVVDPTVDPTADPVATSSAANGDAPAEAQSSSAAEVVNPETPASSSDVVPASSSTVAPASSSDVVPASSANVVPASSSSVVASSSSQVVKPASSSAAQSSSSVVKSSSSVAPASSSSVTPAASSVKKSAGCGKSTSIKTGSFTINVNGKNRNYAIDVPANYDPNKAYKLFYTSHWYGGKYTDVVSGSTVPNGTGNWSFFGLKRQATLHNEQAIFIAPGMNGATWDLGGTGDDHKLFDALLNYAKSNLCVDEDRVFATGFSFGAMMTYSLSLTHQDQLRAVATLAAANFVGNASSGWNPFPADSKKKIAYLGITGMSDGTCPYNGNESNKRGGYFCASLHAQNNGCDMPAGPNAITKTNAGSKTHVTYDFKNCDAGYPVKYITFDGGHIAAPTDGQTSDDGLKTWAPAAMWDFFSQF